MKKMQVKQQLDLDTINVDNIDLSLLIKGKADHEYLESLTELEWEAILGEHFESLKDEIDMEKAACIAASLAAVVGMAAETEWEDVGAPSPIITELLGLVSSKGSPRVATTDATQSPDSAHTHDTPNCGQKWAAAAAAAAA